MVMRVNLIYWVVGFGGLSLERRLRLRVGSG